MLPIYGLVALTMLKPVHRVSDLPMCSRQERKWLERKKLHQDTKMFLMQCWYISLNTSLNELTRRNKTLVEGYHVKLSRK